MNMKKTVSGLLMAVLLTGAASDNSRENYMKCFEKACEIEYISPFDNNDEWQTPKQTAERKKGDCKAKAFYLHSLLKKEGIYSRVVFGYMNNNFDNGHAWVEIDYNGKTLILDSYSKKIHRKRDFIKIPNYDYIEYHESLGFKRDIKDFILRYENER